MFRKLTLVSAVSLALLPGAAGALGLGGIGTESALNEPFSGQIELSGVQPDELAAVKALLATEAEFNKIGAPRTAFLDQLRFTPEVSTQGKPVIRVTSTVPVREPYLEFLIEVTWPKGRLIQEYTVLLDPPVTLDRAPPQVAQPEIAAPEPRPVDQSEPPTLPPPRAVQSPSPADAAAFPLRYGPVESGAGLLRIARKMSRSSGGSVEQTAMALYRNNQHAFIRGDINKLKVGQLLEIPTAAELSALDTAAAKREFQSALQGKAVTSTPLTDITAAPQPADRLQIAGMAEPTSAQEKPPEVPAEPELASEAAGEASGPGGEASPGGTAPELGAIKQDLLLVQEAGESSRQETAELRNRVSELETQLADIQRLLKLSNERFAQLQSAGLDRSGTAVADQPLPAASEGTAQIASEGESSEIAAEPISDEAAAAQEPPSDVEEAADESAQAPVQEPKDPAFWESIPQHMWAVVLAVPTLLLIVGWMIRKRRRSLEESLRLSDFTLETRDAGAASGFGEAASAAKEVSESSASSAQTLSPYSGFGNLEDETEEADIVSEADVYIAYGRYREAESLLEGEIVKSPDRLDVKYKLAEAYYGARNLQGMEALMAELQRAGGDRIHPERWQRLNTMLRDLAGPDADGPLQPAAVDEMPKGVRAGGPGEPLRPFFSSPIPPGSAPAPVISTPDVESEADPLAALPRSSDSQDRLSQELDLDVADLDVITGGSGHPAGDEELEMSGAASDLELKLEDLESLRDLDLATFSNRAPHAHPASAQSPGPLTVDGKGDSLDIAPIGKDSLASDVLSSQWRMDSGIWDEVATKIDLARAYMEMEDPEAARVILEEVAQEGNEGQRAEAREMMAQMG